MSGKDMLNIDPTLNESALDNDLPSNMTINATYCLLRVLGILHMNM